MEHAPLGATVVLPIWAWLALVAIGLVAMAVNWGLNRNRFKGD